MKKAMTIILLLTVCASGMSQQVTKQLALKKPVHRIPSVPLTKKAKTVVNGSIYIKNLKSGKVQLKEGNVVGLFKDFKTGKYPIHFSFEGKNLRKDEQGRDIVLIQFETEIYRNKKSIRKVVRSPMPFFPGEMLEPIEAFDIIHLLTYAQGDPFENTDYPGQLDKGTYTIVLRAKPLGADGEIKEFSFVVWI